MGGAGVMIYLLTMLRVASLRYIRNEEGLKS